MGHLRQQTTGLQRIDVVDDNAAVLAKELCLTRHDVLNKEGPGPPAGWDAVRALATPGRGTPRSLTHPRPVAEPGSHPRGQGAGQARPNPTKARAESATRTASITGQYS
jgi:hypothetical protein